MKLYKTILSTLNKPGIASQNNTQQIRTTSETDALASVRTLFEITRDQIADQQKQIDGLDTKASVILGATTVLAGTTSVLLYGLITSHAPMLTDRFLRWLPLALIVVYLKCDLPYSMDHTFWRRRPYPESPQGRPGRLCIDCEPVNRPPDHRSNIDVSDEEM